MKLVKATLIKKSTADGFVTVKDNIEIGKEYLVDLDSIKKNILMYNVLQGKNHEKDIIDIYENGIKTGLYPLEFLNINGRN